MTRRKEPLTARHNFRNQFETPVLFYAAVLTALVTGAGDIVVLALAWIFVASRLAHAWIHLTTNKVLHRFSAFCVGLVALIFMWIWLALQIFAFGV